MDILSYAIASKQSRRIKRFIANPDSNSGILTTPSKIEAGEVITIPAGRTAILPDIVIEGEIIIEGDVFIPSGGSYNQVDVICDNVISKDKSVTIGTKQLVDTVREQDISGKKNFLNGLTTQGENITPYSGFKNLLVNGNFDIWNSGTTFTGTNDILTADRWRYHCAAGGSVFKGTTSGILGKTYPLAMTKTVSTPYQFIAQALPSAAYLSGKTVTVSCKVYCTDGLTKVALGITGNEGINSSVVQTTPSWNESEVFNIGNGVLKTISKTITLPTFGNDFYTLSVYIGIGDAITTELGTVYIREVQLEVGNKATPFEYRPYDLEILLCGEPYKPLARGYKPFSMVSRKGIKNILINGMFNIWQRGTSLTGVMNNQFLADRWICSAGTGIAYSVSKQVINSNPYISMTSTVAGSYLILSQMVENQSRMLDRTFTLNSLFSATPGETVRIYFSVAGVGDYAYKDIIATGGTQELSLTFYMPGNFTPDDNNNYGIRVQSSSNPKVLNVFVMQLEESPYFTGYENRPVGLEMMLCQRYYQRFVNNGGTGELFSHERVQNATLTVVFVTKTIPFKVPMRTYPTITIPRVYANGVDYDTGWILYTNGVNNGMGGIAIYKGGVMTNNSIIAFDAIADAEI